MEQRDGRRAATPPRRRRRAASAARPTLPSAALAAFFTRVLMPRRGGACTAQGGRRQGFSRASRSRCPFPFPFRFRVGPRPDRERERERAPEVRFSPRRVPLGWRVMDLSPRAVIAGRYRVDTKVGAGGMGEVWSGEHVGIGVRVAVKTLLPAAAMNHEVVARFKREAYAARPHPQRPRRARRRLRRRRRLRPRARDGVRRGRPALARCSRRSTLDVEETHRPRRRHRERAQGPARGEHHPPRPQAREHHHGAARPTGGGARSSSTSA